MVWGMKTRLFFFLLLSAQAFAGCTMVNNIVVCNGHVASLAETQSLLPPEYGGKPSAPAQKIKRSQTARLDFMAQNPCPSGGTRYKCPGYIIDHVTPLACGGADDPTNMQWQTVADAKAKDKWERRGCGR
jgi:hypothetical protein